MKIHLIMPMGGKGSRFFENGFEVPKPIIEINSKPFLYWSTKSISNFIKLIDITFVVLQEHVDNFNIDKIIKNYFPDAHIVIIPEVLNGAVLTSLKGISNINDEYPILFNDCDHMFKSTAFEKSLLNNENTYDGALLTFNSNEDKYSYVIFDENKNVIGTKEKVVMSDEAICGAYYFKNAKLFEEMANSYLKTCDYSEFYMSGVYNEMVKNNKLIKSFICDFHVPFGIPSEYEKAKDSIYFEELL